MWKTSDRSQIKWFLLICIAITPFQAPFAEAKSKCEKIKFSCDDGEATLSENKDGKDKPISCGKNTGNGQKGGPCKLGVQGKGSGQKGLLAAGQRNFQTEPPGCICDNCVIHEPSGNPNGNVVKGSDAGAGCINVEKDLYEMLLECGEGTEFEVINKKNGHMPASESSTTPRKTR